VRLSQPEAVQLKDFDRAFGFDDDGRLVQRSGHAQLQAAATRQQMDRTLFPALNAPFDALAKDPGNWDAALRAGIVYSQWGEWDSAADFLVRSAELNHYQNPYPLFFLGKVRQSQGMLDEARRCFAQAVALSAGERNPAFQEAIEQLRKK
jgi:tetratricopeptide (TPR) repeat protein